MRNAKIVCTIGPASDSVGTLAELAEAGMAVARMNASHGSPDHRREVIDRIRAVDERVDRPVAAMHDLPGPEVRTAPLADTVHLQPGSRVTFVEGREATSETVGLSHSIAAVEPGDRVLLDDGRIETTVELVNGDTVTATVENGGELGGRKGVNVPGVELGLPTITEKDRTELEVAAEKEVDFVAASFVRDGAFVYEIDRALEELGADIPVIAKIERDVAVENIDSIVMLSGETAMGDHPVRVVETMDRIVRDVEASPEYAETIEQAVPVADATRADALARSARFLATDIGASAIVVASESGYTALKAAKFRPSIPVVATTPSDEVRRRLTLSWGIQPATTPYTAEGASAVINSAVQSAIDVGAAESGDTVVVLSGMMTELEGVNTSNMLKVHVASETVGSGRSVVAGLVSGRLHWAGDGDLSDVPEGAILCVSRAFDGEFVGDPGKLGGIVDAHEGTTSYAAMVARELSIPMVSAVSVGDRLTAGDVVTLDAERGLVYDGAIHQQAEAGR